MSREKQFEVSRQRDRGSEICTRILDGAETIFVKFGCLNATVTDIARESGISTTTIYRYYESKAVIMEALISRDLQRMENMCQRIAEENAPASKKLSTIILEYHKKTLTRKCESKGTHAVVCTAMRENRLSVEEHSEQMRRLVWLIILEGIHNGEFKVTNIDEAAKMVCYALRVFLDPSLAVPLFANDKDYAQVRTMDRFIQGSLMSGCV